MLIQSYAAGDIARTELHIESADRWKIETTIKGTTAERVVYGDEKKARSEFEKEKRFVDRKAAKIIERSNQWD